MTAPIAGTTYDAEDPYSTARKSVPTRTARRRWLIVLIVMVLVAGSLLAYRLRSHSGWTEIWHDDFAGASGTAPSSKNWSMTTGTSYPGGPAQWGTGELETYSDEPANIGLDGNGHLRITAIQTDTGMWTSARIESRRADFEPAAGGQLRVQAKIQTADGGAGYWPAFWMLGAPFRGVYTNWPGIGEIDIMENSGGVPDTVHGTLHCGVNPGGPCNETNGISAARSVGAALSSGFHSYAVVWDRSQPVESITWYIDDQPYQTVRSSDVDAATWNSATHHGFFVLLNLAVGGSFPGPTDATTKASSSMLVDDVSVSRR